MYNVSKVGEYCWEDRTMNFSSTLGVGIYHLGQVAQLSPGSAWGSC